jgi:hypothetical protein
VTERRVIPDENSSTLIPPAEDDNDMYTELLNDGAGEEDHFDDDSDDESDDPNANTSHGHSAKSRIRHQLPNWLREQFNRHLEESNGRERGGLPPLYRDHQTFWFPKPSPYFALQNVNVLSPHKLFHADFFLWDPEALLLDGIPCPHCSTKLHRHGSSRVPRRCVDLHRTFWIIGYIYRCPACVNVKSQKKTVTFRSWDTRIIQQLPRSLASQFPAMLSFRSGISESLFMFMRSCFQSGMGSKQFSDALRTRHLESYDQLYASYLSKLATMKDISEWRGRKFAVFLPFDDRSPDGFHGYVPSGQWLRDMFDNFMDIHGHEIDQAMAMLSGSICAIDHSFKVCSTTPYCSTWT